MDLNSKKKYEVIIQHTLVQINPETSEKIKSWTGSNTLDQLSLKII
jgi:hypothetical protein